MSGLTSVAARLWDRLPLSGKIILPYLLLTLFAGIGGTFLASRLIAGGASDRLTIAVVEAARAANRETLAAEAARLEAIRQVLDRDDIALLVARRDLDAMEATFDSVPDRVSWLAIVDTGGMMLATRARDDTTLPAPEVLSGSSAVRSALAGVVDERGERHAGVIVGGDTAALVAVAPLRDGGHVVGALIAASDARASTAAIKRASLADVAILDRDGVVLGSTIPSELLDRLPLTGVDDEARPVDLMLDGRASRFVAAPLQLRGDRHGMLVVALPTDVIVESGREARLQLVLLISGAMILTVLLGLAIARHITGPIRRLADAARALGSGDLVRRSGVQGSDEVGVLGATFDRMAASLDLRQNQLSEAYLNTVRSLALAVDAKDPYTHGHSQRVSTFCTLVARQLQLDDAVVQEIEMAGLLHDVGKIGVPDGVLTKPGKLDDEEWSLIRRHPTIGADILRPIGFGPNVMDLVLYHHERLNGRGFPEGLAGDAIPLVARIAAVCDAYDAMTSDRSYRRSLGHDGAIAELRRGAGDQFDHRCVDAFIAVIGAAAPQENGAAPIAV